MAVDDKKKPNLILKFAMYGGILFFLILACLRFYAGYLEQQVFSMSRTIEQLSVQEVSLKQQLSALKSPNRIYNYCKDTLKMERSTPSVIKITKNE